MLGCEGRGGGARGCAFEVAVSAAGLESVAEFSSLVAVGATGDVSTFVDSSDLGAAASVFFVSRGEDILEFEAEVF